MVRFSIRTQGRMCTIISHIIAIHIATPMKITRFQTFLVGSIAVLTIAVSPVLVLGKENQNRGNGQGQDEQDNKPKTVQQDNSCVKAFGHLIAPGWIKHNGQVNLGDECPLPFGITNILGGHRGDGDGNGTSTGTTTATTSAPLILSAVNATVYNSNQAVIGWSTNRPSDSTVYYSTSTPVNVASSTTITSSVNVYNHFLVLNGLTASTTYHYIVVSHDVFGNTATSSELSFSTPSAPIVNPLMISNAVAIVGTSTVDTSWVTNIAADSQVYYSTSSPVVIGASSTTAITTGALVTNHEINVTGLATSTTYYFIIQSKDAAGDVQTTNQFSLKTGM